MADPVDTKPQIEEDCKVKECSKLVRFVSFPFFAALLRCCVLAFGLVSFRRAVFIIFVMCSGDRPT